MLVEEQDLSIMTGSEGHRTKYSVPEFTDYFSLDLSSEKLEHGWVFWRPEIYQQLSVYDFDSSSRQKGIISVLKATASNRQRWIWCESLVQFWTAKVDDAGHRYLTTSDQPFCLRDLYKGCCWYRKQCMNHCYYVVEVEDEQLGPVGRVYRNKRPESSPDLRLYSTIEFPLRDAAARCGLTSYLALPVFDLLKNDCYGVLEVLSITAMRMTNQFLALDIGLQVGGLRSTHTNFFPISHFDLKPMSPKYTQQPESEISRMFELAIVAVPELHLVQVWVPCKQCNDLSCLERSTFITADSEILNSCKPLGDDMFEYLQACEFHNLHLGKGIASIMSADRKSCFRRTSYAISENPLAHYAQRARLSLCFAVSLESVHNSNDLYFVEFFLKSNCGDSFLHLLSRIMETELKSYKFSFGGQLADQMKHQHSKQINVFTPMERYWEIYSESNFKKYMQTADLRSVLLSQNNKQGWIFWSQYSRVHYVIKQKIVLSIKRIASEWYAGSYRLVQFWAPKMEEGRCYLSTLDQPYALGSLHKGLALFRKKCMQHNYYVDEGAKEEELGPPGRVFRNAQPETTPDLRLYSTREFSLRNYAAQCHLRNYRAIPVFDSDKQKCVGVLELVEFTDWISIENIQRALEGTNLSSTQSRFKRSFRASHTLSNNLALTEVGEAFQMISGIPQLRKAEVRIPYDDSNMCCMELVWSSEYLKFDDVAVDKIHERTRKGIAELVLASENKSCFCWNSCDFSITEQPLAHYEQRERLDVSFAICLQSSHTGNLLYVVEFFLNQGPATYEYLLSFLKFLLPIMKQKLKSFKVASGKQLGEELVVDIFEFSELNEPTFSELEQPADTFPFKFKIVRYGRKEHQHSNDLQAKCVCDHMDSVASGEQADECSSSSDNSEKDDAEEEHQHTNDQLLQYVPRDMDFATSGAQATKCSVAAENSKKEDETKKSEQGKGKIGLHLKIEDLEPHYGKRLKDVQEELGVGRSTIKRLLRENNISRWPNHKKYKKNPSLFMKERECQIAQQNMQPSSSRSHPLHQNVPQTNTESTQNRNNQVEAQEVMIKVKYKGDTIKFLIHLSSGIEKVVEEVARRLHFETRNFKLKYVDEDSDEILLTCDDDLKICVKSVPTLGKACVHLFVEFNH